MITLAVAAILLGLAVPSYREFVQNNRLVSQTNALIADLALARSEAVKRAVPVVLCRSSNPSVDPPSCGGAGQTWTTGWLVFVDANGDNSYLPANNDVLLRVGQPAPGNLIVMANATADAAFGYQADGTANAGGNTGRFAICDDRGESAGRQINIGPVGRPQLVTGVSDAPITNCANPA